MSQPKPTEDQINEVLNQCAEQIDDGNSKFHGMSYEEGVKAGIEWVMGWGNASNPMED